MSEESKTEVTCNPSLTAYEAAARLMEQTGMDITVTNNYLPCKAAIFPWAPEAICATYVCVYHLEQRTMIMTEGQNNYKP